MKWPAAREEKSGAGCPSRLREKWPGAKPADSKKKRKEIGWDKEKKRQTRPDDPSGCFATWTVSRDPRCQLCQAGWTASCSDDAPSGCADAPPRERRQSSRREIRPDC
ncbi:hypothetical protein VPH35_104320 [Triticum aestivum]